MCHSGERLSNLLVDAGRMAFNIWPEFANHPRHDYLAETTWPKPTLPHDRYARADSSASEEPDSLDLNARSAGQPSVNRPAKGRIRPRWPAYEPRGGQVTIRAEVPCPGPAW